MIGTRSRKASRAAHPGEWAGDPVYPEFWAALIAVSAPASGYPRFVAPASPASHAAPESREWLRTEYVRSSITAEHCDSTASFDSREANTRVFVASKHFATTSAVAATPLGSPGNHPCEPAPCARVSCSESPVGRILPVESKHRRDCCLDVARSQFVRRATGVRRAAFRGVPARRPSGLCNAARCCGAEVSG